MINFIFRTLKMLIGFAYFSVLFPLFGYVAYAYYFTDQNVHWLNSISPLLCVAIVFLFSVFVYEIKKEV